MSRMTAVSIYRFGVSMPRLEPLGRVFYDLPGAVSETMYVIHFYQPTRVLLNKTSMYVIHLVINRIRPARTWRVASPLRAFRVSGSARTLFTLLSRLALALSWARAPRRGARGARVPARAEEATPADHFLPEKSKLGLVPCTRLNGQSQW